MEVYVVSFDIHDDGRRRRIGEALLGYGERVQRSVFEVSVRDRAQLDGLCAELKGLIEPGDDDVRLYRLCANCRGVSFSLSGEAVAHFPALLIV